MRNYAPITFSNVTGSYWGFTLTDGALRMLAVGLGLQVAGLPMLSAIDPAWSAAASVAWVMAAQGNSGIAKDLTKTAFKAAIKAVVVDPGDRLFRYAGSKKAAEDVGFYHAANAGGRFLGIVLSGLLTQWGGLQASLWALRECFLSAWASPSCYRLCIRRA